jgi:hypothetical protein
MPKNIMINCECKAVQTSPASQNSTARPKMIHPTTRPETPQTSKPPHTSPTGTTTTTTTSSTRPDETSLLPKVVNNVTAGHGGTDVTARYTREASAVNIFQNPQVYVPLASVSGGLVLITISAIIIKRQYTSRRKRRVRVRPVDTSKSIMVEMSDFKSNRGNDSSVDETFVSAQGDTSTVAPPSGEDHFFSTSFIVRLKK